MAINYGLDRVRFITPVRVGSKIRARVKLAEAKPFDGGMLKIESTIEIEGVETSCSRHREPCPVVRLTPLPSRFG